ncbi:Dabb family protein [Pseudomonas oryzihabitans]|uniref:Stress responsive protein n=1 Tax=Pseudomonas oryzihabitans TaxID=47885 RepID=A0A2Z5ACP9_9PSED|nr:Dabb family protein [Pseudomonas oryzihabitans]AXA67849.1 stress responsive protein [Pseudomonas oryzihabitans]
MSSIKHIVMWNLQGENAEERSQNIEKLKNAFEGIRDLIPGLRTLEIGVDFSRIDYACDVVLYSEFDSMQALADYAIHPAHLRVREELGGLRIARHQVDYVS